MLYSRPYIQFSKAFINLLFIWSIQLSFASFGIRILTRGEGFVGANNYQDYGAPAVGEQWRWHRSWGDTSGEFGERRRHRFCFRHPDAPQCNGPPFPRPGFGPRPFAPPAFGPPPPPFEGPPPPVPLPVVIEKEVWKETAPVVQQPTDLFTTGFRYGYLPEAARKSIIATCSSGLVNCKAQSPAMAAKRNVILQREQSTQRFYNPSSASSSYSRSTPSVVERQIDMVQSLKKSLLDAAGLSNHVAPINDGTFEHDVLLTEEQSTTLMSELKKGQRYKRASLFLEQMPTKRWDSGQPIPYFFDDNIAEFEKQMVRQAHQMIEGSTCLRFQFNAVKPAGSHLYYAKIPSPAFCGLSYIGKVSPANPIYLSFMCQDPVGVALHETMHALGANHEHLRSDRDDFIDIQWGNINPQFYDYFAIADSSKFTPYGVPYAYDSIMHYNAFTAGIDASKPTMIPKQNKANNMPLMGQRKRLGNSDIALLNAMYCKQGCEDKNVYCGVWSLRNLCNTQAQAGWMSQNCQKSCKLC